MPINNYAVFIVTLGFGRPEPVKSIVSESENDKSTVPPWAEGTFLGK